MGKSVWVYAQICMCMYVCVCILIRINVYVCAYMRMSMCVHAYMRVFDEFTYMYNLMEHFYHPSSLNISEH